LAQFVDYKNGNVLVNLLNRNLNPERKVIEVPIYYTRFVVASKNKRPQSVLNTFNSANIDLTSQTKQKDLKIKYQAGCVVVT
jgi:hypothetical protein